MNPVAGAAPTNDVTCKRCQALVSDGSALCSNCGTPMRAATSSRSLEDLGGRKALPPGHGLSLWVASDGITLGIEIDHLELIDVAGVTRPVDSMGSSTITNDVAFEIDGLVYPVGSMRLDGEHARTDMDATELVRISQQFRTGCTSEALDPASLERDVAMFYDELMQQELSFVRVNPLEVHSKVTWLQKARRPVD